MSDQYHAMGRALRERVEAQEDNISDDDVRNRYTADLESFIDHVVQPILFEYVANSVTVVPGQLEEYPEDLRDPSEAKKEFENYWEPRFGTRKGGTGLNELYLDQFCNEVEDFDDFDTLVAPAVGGIFPGLIAKYSEDFDDKDFVVVGYQEKDRNKPREIAFTTEDIEGDVLIIEDGVSSGASVAGIDESAKRADSMYVVTESCGRYEVVGSMTKRYAERLLSSDEHPEADEIVKNGRTKVTVNDGYSDVLNNVGAKAISYGMGAGVTGGGLFLLLNGEATLGQTATADHVFGGAFTVSGSLFTLVERMAINDSRMDSMSQELLYGLNRNMEFVKSKGNDLSERLHEKMDSIYSKIISEENADE